MTSERVALIIIGRNEAETLERSLPAVRELFSRIVYVDSGSDDNSVALARSHGATPIELDTSVAFTAARARNAGLQEILKDRQRFDLVQFIDGDCELITDFLQPAIDWLKQHPDYGMVCGQRIERFPQGSVFNQLCDIEWNTPIGDTRYCGGDVLVRLSAIAAVEGYNEQLIAGEDPELCVRLRQAGWKLRRIDQQMTLHDANITRVSQWWRRHVRAGYAFAEGAHLHGAAPEYHWIKESRSNWLYGSWFFVVLLFAIVLHPAWLALLAIFPAQVLRLMVRAPHPLDGQNLKLRLLFAIDCFAAKIPQFIGQCRYLLNRISNRRQALIEYK